MNGWFMHHPTKFPPSKWINPLFVSFHVVPRNAVHMLTPETVEYLKEHQPIGARDTGTCELLRSKGIESYFSGCLTLTLGETYHSEEKDEKIYFVDPYYEFGRSEKSPILHRLINATCDYMRYRKKVKQLRRYFVCEFRSPIARISKSWDRNLMVASFYRTYSTLFADDVLFSAEYISHKVDQRLFHSDKDKLEYARDLLKKYARARFVVTSRIHCALPCIGIETPVLFVTSEMLEGDSLRSAGRFGGLTDLLHVLRWTPEGIINFSSLPLSSSVKVTRSTIFKNKEDYKTFKFKLIKRVKEFLTTHK